MQPGSPATNRLGLWAYQGQVKVYLNDAFQLEERIASENSGGLAVFARSIEGSAMTVTYSFSNGTATGGSDFTNTGTSVAIANGSTTTTISVPVINDDIVEATEDFAVTVTGSPHGQVSASTDGSQTSSADITS